MYFRSGLLSRFSKNLSKIKPDRAFRLTPGHRAPEMRIADYFTIGDFAKGVPDLLLARKGRGRAAGA